MMSEIFMEMIRDLFDRHTPEKKIRVHANHVKSLSDEAKPLMKERNNARNNVKHDKYKRLKNGRNIITRIEKQIEALNMIQEYPNNIWKIHNRTFTGRRYAKIKIKEDD